jgi:putative transposase
MTWAAKRGIHIEYIQPDNPQQNACIQSYSRTVRGEWLGQNIVETIEEAQEQATQWLWTYNNDRPKMSISGITAAMKLKMAPYSYRRTPLRMGDWRLTSIRAAPGVCPSRLSNLPRDCKQDPNVTLSAPVGSNWRSET